MKFTPAKKSKIRPAKINDAMKDMPPPIDLEAVQRLKSEIANNEYPVDYDKISEALILPLLNASSFFKPISARSKLVLLFLL